MKIWHSTLTILLQPSPQDPSWRKVFGAYPCCKLDRSTTSDSSISDVMRWSYLIPSSNHGPTNTPQGQYCWPANEEQRPFPPLLSSRFYDLCHEFEIPAMLSMAKFYHAAQSPIDVVPFVTVRQVDQYFQVFFAQVKAKPKRFFFESSSSNVERSSLQEWSPKDGRGNLLHQIKGRFSVRQGCRTALLILWAWFLGSGKRLRRRKCDGSNLIFSYYLFTPSVTRTCNLGRMIWINLFTFMIKAAMIMKTYTNRLSDIVYRSASVAFRERFYFYLQCLLNLSHVAIHDHQLPHRPWVGLSHRMHLKNGLDPSLS